jgi:hypothetical protein
MTVSRSPERSALAGTGWAVSAVAIAFRFMVRLHHLFVASVFCAGRGFFFVRCGPTGLSAVSPSARRLCVASQLTNWSALCLAFRYLFAETLDLFVFIANDVHQISKLVGLTPKHLRLEFVPTQLMAHSGLPRYDLIMLSIAVSTTVE